MVKIPARNSPYTHSHLHCPVTNCCLSLTASTLLVPGRVQAAGCPALRLHCVSKYSIAVCSLKPDGDVDPSSLHGSCATTKGEKWSATKWMHVGPIGLSVEAQKAKWGDCIDGDSNCGEWAAVGQCTENPGYMMSTCRKACKACRDQDTFTGDARH